MNVRRRKGLACSSLLNQDSSASEVLKGNVYNIFPFLRDPDLKKQKFPMDRAFTFFGIFEGMFYPICDLRAIEQNPSTQFYGRLVHEWGHLLLGGAHVTCEERVLAAELLGQAWNFIGDAEGDAKLLIPSFTIVGPAGKNFALKKLADRREKLFDAKYAVHEIIACTIQADVEGWDRDKTKRVIRQQIGGDLLDKKVMDNFLDINERLSIVGSCSLGHYALNVRGLTQRTALARFEHAIKVATGLIPDLPLPGQIRACVFCPPGQSKDCVLCPLPETARLMAYLRFIKHLDSNLPDYNIARCPLAGACFPNKLDAWAESITNRSTEDGASAVSFGEEAAAEIYDASAWLMRKSGCDRKEQFALGNNLLPAYAHELIRVCDERALTSVDPHWQERTERVSKLTILTLIDHDNCDHRYTVGLNFEERSKPLSELTPITFIKMIENEASLQQMTLGEGPFCLCYPHQPADCSYRPGLQELWDYTEPDPEWENNWKKPEKKPPCIE